MPREDALLKRNVLIILAAIQITWPAGLALVTGSADGMTGLDLAALLAAQAVGVAGLTILARMREPLSRPTTAKAIVLLVIALGANLTLAVTNLLGVTTGAWCLPLVLGLIPVIGLLYAHWNLRKMQTTPYFRSAAPVGTMTSSRPSI